MTTVVGSPAEIIFRDLPDEPFGSKLRRARELADMTLEEAAKRISVYWPVSGATLSRIENSIETGRPKDAQRRTIASIAVVLYRVLPSDIGVDLGDVPRNILDDLARRPSDGEDANTHRESLSVQVNGLDVVRAGVVGQLELEDAPRYDLPAKPRPVRIAS